MESGLARFAVLIVLFFLLTGDLAGMFKHLYEDHGGSHGTPERQRRTGGDGKARPAADAAAAATAVHADDNGPALSSSPGGDESAETDPDVEAFTKSYSARMKLVNIIKESCLPKLICELTASTNRDTLTESERYLLSLIRETTISTTAEVTSKYHFAAHMGQLINGIDNTGCHNFYPACPFPGLQVMQMLQKVKLL